MNNIQSKIEKEPTKAVVVAGVIIKQDSKFLLVQEKKEKVYGKWNLPAGKVDLGDTIEQTAIKEAKEESGYDVELVNMVGICQEKATDAVKHVYEAKIIGGDLAFPEDEILDAKWFSFDEISEMEEKSKLRDPYVLESIKLFEKK